MKPATRLPWLHVVSKSPANPYWRDSSLWAGEGRVVDMSCPNALAQGDANAAYIAHAANAYPRLVAALRDTLRALEVEHQAALARDAILPADTEQRIEAARALLRELGEVQS